MVQLKNPINFTFQFKSMSFMNLAGLSAPVWNMASLLFRRNDQDLLTKMNPDYLRVLCVTYVINKYVNAKICIYVK